MIHYCRYCIEAVAQGGDYAWCEAKQKMVGRTSRMNACKDFNACDRDAFAGFRGLEFDDPRASYHPRPFAKKAESKQLDGQISIFDKDK